MKYIKLFEEHNNEDIIIHLKKRGIDPEKTKVIIDEETEDTYFYLYNLSGQLVGYQKYNPNYPKINTNNPKLAKYFTHSTENMISVWGLESLNLNDEFIFLVEGIFDAARIQESGYPALALLCNNPDKSLKSWLKTLPQKKIVIYDNDEAGKKLIKVGDFAYTVPVGKDVNDLNPEEAKEFLKKCLEKSK